MAVLEKNYLLYFLILSFLLLAGPQKEELKFFDKSVKFFDFGAGCEECEEETQSEKPLPLSKQAQYEIILFISLSEPTEKNKKVIEEIKSFTNRNPEFQPRGYIIDKVENFKELALKNYQLFDNTFEFEFDPMMKEAIERNIKYVPTCLVLDKNGKEKARITSNFFEGLLQVKQGKK
jgi:hypothetical protein